MQNNMEQQFGKLQVPKGKIDVVLDTDAYNEIDDQFAIAYLLRSKEKLETKAIYAAPFFNLKSSGPQDGMEKSYDEILKLLRFTEEERPVFKGAIKYLPDEKTPVISDAANDLVERAMRYTPENPLYVVAIGAITNVASALLIKPQISHNIVVVWLGGHAWHFHDTREFNMYQDVAAVRVVMNSDVAFVQLPCMGVVSEFAISGSEVKEYLLGKGELADYLGRGTIEEADRYALRGAWTRVIWDVTAIAWLLNDDDRFMNWRIVSRRKPNYELQYENENIGRSMIYVYHINRDALWNDLIKKIVG